MKILAIETATEACSCALWVDGAVYQRYELAPRQHAAMILTMADEILIEAELQPSQLDAIAFGRGPGSFTGLRIACGVAQGMALGLDIPLIPLSTLAILAQTVYEYNQQRQIFACLDARMEQVYWACYEVPEGMSFVQASTAEQLTTSPSVSLPQDKSWFGAGSGWQNYAADLQHLTNITNITNINTHQVDYYPQARAMLVLAVVAYTNEQVVAAELAQPIYLRNNIINNK